MDQGKLRELSTLIAEMEFPGKPEHQKTNNVQLLPGSGNVQWRITFVALQVAIRTMFEQHCDQGCVALLTGTMKGRPTQLVVCCVGIPTMFQNQANHFHVSFVNRNVQGSPTVLVLVSRRSTMFQKQLE